MKTNQMPTTFLYVLGNFQFKIIDIFLFILDKCINIHIYC